MTHGSAGAFDIQLPLTGGTGVECRQVTGGMKIVLTFDQNVTGGTAAVTSGDGLATINGTPAFALNTMSVALAHVSDMQAISITAQSVTNSSSETLASATVNCRVLLGDVNANGLLTGSDLNIVRAAIASGSPVNGANFRCDLNVNGVLTGSDLNIDRAQIAGGGNVPGGSTANTPPAISSISNVNAVTGVASTVSFTVGDAESDPSTIAVVATSSDQATIPNANLTVSGSGTSRTMTITPVTGLTTSTTVTITAMSSDGLASSAPITFTVYVTPPPTVYLAILQPVAGVTSLGSGSATLTLSGDLSSAILKYGVSNLTGTDSDDAVYAPGNNVLYDIPVGKAKGNQQPDGSYLWTFTNGGTNTIASIVAAIQANTAYMIIETSTYPAGELTGTFKLINGSQTFTPPAAPPQITINPPTAADASRFLQQSQFGGTTAEITSLSNANAANANTAINDWLTAQFNAQAPIAPDYSAVGTPGAATFSSSSMYQWIYGRVTTSGLFADQYQDDRIIEAWWRNANTAPDQLRQRVATALSEIFVVSQIDSEVDDNELGLATYYDMLADDAFGNFRRALGDVTLHPAMGEYLNMMNNNWINASTSPNENYAREIMQLFTIGLYMLQPDGTLMLDQNGQPIPTYGQATITQFANVFTGWNQDPTDQVVPLKTQNGTQNLDTFWQRPMVLAPASAAYHSQLSKTLLNYAGAAAFPGASQPAFIPANASQTAASATQELNFALDNIFNHPNVGPFVCKQLIQRLVCSNPSPGYVYRVAQVFNNDGTSVRGNMKAVITAILTDYEARSPALVSNPGYGHAREPMVRIASIMRSLGAKSKSTKWEVGKTDTTLAQTIFRSPTVLNFFTPTYQQSGAIQQAGLVSPELQVIYATTAVNSQNMLYTGINGAGYNTSGSPTLTGTGFMGDGWGSDVYLDLSTGGSGLVSLAQTDGVGTLVDQVGLLLMGPPMPAAMRSAIVNYITTSVGATNYVAQVQAAVYLVGSSSQAAVQK
jgi:uncharacterized protein (DUF1800 family)